MAFDFPNIDPIAFSIGPLLVRWYSLAYLAGFLGGWKYCLYMVSLDKNHRPSKEDIDDFLPWVILGVIFGGRFGYVLFYQFALYAENPLEILKVWHGGMSFHGGVLGVVLALIIYPMVKGFSRLRLSDMVCAAVPIGLFFGRIANFINGELFGRITTVEWGIVFPGGGGVPRHPSQLYEAALEGLGLFVILFFIVRSDVLRNKPGVVTGVFLIGYGIFRSVVELFREPDRHIGLIMDGFSMGQLLSVPMVVAGVGFIVYALRARHDKEPA